MSKLTLEKASLRYGIPLLTLHGAIDRGLLQTDADRSLESTDIEVLIDRLLKSFCESVRSCTLSTNRSPVDLDIVRKA